MILEVIVGDLLDQRADALLVTANPWLQMTGGVNGAIRARGNGAIQDELNRRLAELGVKAVPQGTVVETGAGNLNARLLLHCVAIDPFYGSSAEAVRGTVAQALLRAAERGCATVAMPMLATGYGPLRAEDFARGLKAALMTAPPSIERLTVVVRKKDDRDAVERTCAGPSP